MACCSAPPRRSRPPAPAPAKLRARPCPEPEPEPEPQPQPPQPQQPQSPPSRHAADASERRRRRRLELELERAVAAHGEEFGEMDEPQRRQCAELRRRLPPDDSDGLPTAEMVVRFLRATKFSLDERHRDPARRQDPLAERMLQRHVRWRRQWRPDQVVAADCPNALRSGAGRLLGVGPRGNPVVWAQAGRWNPGDYELDEFVRYCAFFMAEGERRMREHGTSTGIFLIDVAGWELGYIKHLDKIKVLVDVVQNQYPERLERALLVNVPFIFLAAWKIISPLLDPVTREKVYFISAAELETTLARFMTPEITPKQYGGGGLYEHSDLPGQYVLPPPQGKQRLSDVDGGDRSSESGSDDDDFHEVLDPSFFGLPAAAATT